MRKVMLVLVATALAAIATDTAEAQHRSIREVHQHSGFWLSVGAGGGWEDADFTFGNRGRGAAAYLRLGGTVNPHVLFGGEVLAWFKDREGSEVQRVNVTALAQVYPSRQGGWFLKGGFGVAGHERFGIEREGVATTLGTGFDFRIGGNFYVTPNVDYMVQFFENETIGTALFTVGLTWH